MCSNIIYVLTGYKKSAFLATVQLRIHISKKIYNTCTLIILEKWIYSLCCISTNSETKFIDLIYLLPLSYEPCEQIWIWHKCAWITCPEFLHESTQLVQNHNHTITDLVHYWRLPCHTIAAEYRELVRFLSSCPNPGRNWGPLDLQPKTELARSVKVWSFCSIVSPKFCINAS